MKQTLMSSMIAALLVSSPLYADSDQASAVAQLQVLDVTEQQELEPAMLVDQSMDTMLRFLNQEQPVDTQALLGFLEREIVPFFDFAYMAKSAAGTVYRHMQPDQHKRMTENIKQQFLSTMTQRLADYDNQQMRVVSQRYGRDGNTATASMVVLQPEGYPARLDFRFYRSKTGWKVFDVSANGQSAVIHYRRQFQRLMYATRFERENFAGQHRMQRSFRHPTSQ